MTSYYKPLFVEKSIRSALNQNCQCFAVLINEASQPIKAIKRPAQKITNNDPYIMVHCSTCIGLLFCQSFKKQGSYWDKKPNFIA